MAGNAECATSCYALERWRFMGEFVHILMLQCKFYFYPSQRHLTNIRFFVLLEYIWEIGGCLKLGKKDS